MTSEIRISWFGKIGFTFLIILLILLLGATVGIIIGSKTRIKQLENRIVKLEAMEYRLTHILEQAESFEQYKGRFEELESSLAEKERLVKNLVEKLEASSAETEHLVKDLAEKFKASLAETEHLVKDLDHLSKKTDQQIPPKVENSIAPKVPAEIVSKRYHTVTPGETLYSISHRYGLTVEKIRLQNQLTEDSVIHPGQRLLLNP